ncbi:MAG: LamG-like jellyroll fold domain-containing protein [Candidatus Micrarchaeia archaeon]
MHPKGHVRKDEKSQIALEFIIVYSFVLVIFLVIFALIAAQRASTLSAQQFSSLELITQNIATNIDHALAAGSGYTATIPIVGSISALPYNLYLSSTGVVLANMTIGKQVISAEAYSSARSISVNSTFQSQTANGISVYNIPVYTGIMRISNSRGTIYIDQEPVSTAGLPGSMDVGTTSSFNSSALKVVSLKAASFNAATHNIIGIPGTSPAISGPMTVTMWVYWNGGPVSGGNGAGAFTYGDYCGKGFAILVAPTLGMDACDSDNYASSLSLPKKNWTFVAFEITGMSANSIRTWYLNTQNVSNEIVNSYSAPIPTLVYIGDDSVGSIGEYTDFNGSIANVQLYNTTLTANEIYGIYHEGISGLPISRQNLVGWWPLNGNAEDYSGNGNSGSPTSNSATVPYIQYTRNVQLPIGAVLSNGRSASNMLVGMVTSAGHFASGPVLSTRTDANGTIRAYVNSNSSYGIANITINGFNGNLSTVGNLVAWFPLDLGYGNTTYSMVNNLTGTFVNPSWEPMPQNSSSIYVGSFDGSNSIVNTTLSSPHAASGMTISAWINNNGEGNYGQNIAEISGEPYTHETLDIGVTGSNGQAVIRWSNYANTFADQPAGGTIAPNTWYLVTGVWSGFNNTLSIYVNGKMVATGTGNNTGLTSIREINIGGAYPGMYSFNGLIANVQIYNSSLSPAQINSLYSEGMTGTPVGSSGLQAWYPLDGSINDYSSYKNLATGKNVSFSEYLYSSNSSSNYKVASFNGQTGSSYIVTPALTGLNGASGASFNACFYLDSLLTNEILFSDDWSSSQIMQIYIHTNGQLEADYGNGGWFSVALTLPNTIQANRRYCITTTYASGGGQEIYVNGVAQPLTYSTGSATSTGALASGTTGDIAYNQGNGGAFAGQIANIQIYNTTLTPAQAKQLYMQGLPLYKKLNISV